MLMQLIDPLPVGERELLLDEVELAGFCDGEGGLNAIVALQIKLIRRTYLTRNERSVKYFAL
jgi:hypothetical protein